MWGMGGACGVEYQHAMKGGVLITAMDVEKPQKTVREIRSNMEEEGAADVEMRNKQEAAIMAKLSSPCLDELRQALEEGWFKKDVWERISTQFSQIALFRCLYSH